MMISIQSFMTYDSGFNYPKSNHLREVPVVIHSRDADRFMPQLEADLLARYIFAKHRRALETCDTLADGVDARFESLGGDTDALRLASNILAFLEFYLNRFTPLTDDTMRKYLSDARFTIAKLTEYTVGEDAPTKVGQVVNPLLFNQDDLDEMSRFNIESRTIVPKGVKMDHSRIMGALANANIMSTDYDNALESMFGGTKDPADGYHDLFVSVRTDSGCTDGYLKERARRFWERFPDGDSQAGSSETLLPLIELIDVLRRLVREEGSGVLMRAIDDDVFDFSVGKLRPYDIMMNSIGRRDDKLNESRSVMSTLASLDDGAVVRDVAEFARILHCIMMGSVVSPKKTVRFAFNHSDLLRLMDPALFDRNYPSRLIFVSDDRTMEEGYRGYLSERLYDVIDDTILRLNATTSDRLGVLWPENDSAPNRVERDFSRTQIRISTKACRDLCRKDLERSVLVTDVDDLDRLKWRLYEIDPSGDPVVTAVVFNNHHYFSQRIGYESLIEIGIRRDDYATLHGIHRNGIDCRRRNAIDSALFAISETYESDGRDAEHIVAAVERSGIPDTTKLVLGDFIEVLAEIAEHEAMQTRGSGR